MLAVRVEHLDLRHEANRARRALVRVRLGAAAAAEGGDGQGQDDQQSRDSHSRPPFDTVVDTETVSSTGLKGSSAPPPTPVSR